MRLVQVSIPVGKREHVLEILDDETIDYVVTDATNDPDYDAAVFFPLPTDAVQPLLSSLAEVGIEEDAHSVILAAETVVSRDFEELQQQYGNPEEASEQVAFEELRTQARELMPTNPNFALLAIVSAVVATAGLLLDSAAIVVGSMVIAPLVGPAMATSVGTVLDERGLFAEGVKHQFLGLVLTVASATAFALVARTLFLVPPNVEITALEQVASRLTPDLLSLVVAIGAGIAGARSLSGDVSTGFVGVMIAAALVPPIAAVGIGLAWMLPRVVANAGLLVLVNVLSINLAALGTLWYSGYRPKGWGREQRARAKTKTRLAVLLLVVVALTAVLVVFTANAFQTATTTQELRSEVRDVLADERYAGASLEDVQVRYGRSVLRPAAKGVTVTVSRPSEQEYPKLASRIDARIETRTGERVATTVRFVDVSIAS